VRLDKSATESPEMLKGVFGEYSFSWLAVLQWYSSFKASRVSVDDKRSEQPSISKMTGNVKKKDSRSHPWRPSPNNPQDCRHH
jgi:hypothetical protein